MATFVRALLKFALRGIPPPNGWALLTSTRHISTDITKVLTDRRSNLEYDFKRELCEPREVLVGRNFGETNAQHLTLSSKPHRTLEDFQFVRQKFDDWRIKQNGVLKTPDDWTHWKEFRNTATLRKQGVLTGRGSVSDVSVYGTD